jgi:NitT/TauT family transport system substrate-binding protein
MPSRHPKQLGSGWWAIVSAPRRNAFRLHEAGMIKSTPQKLITQGTDWRFLNEILWELKK